MTAEASPWILGLLAGNMIGLVLGYRCGYMACTASFRRRFRRYRGAARRRVCHG